MRMLTSQPPAGALQTPPTARGTDNPEPTGKVNRGKLDGVGVGVCVEVGVGERVGVCDWDAPEVRLEVGDCETVGV